MLCNKFHNIPRDGLKAIKTAKKLFEQEIYLSNDEKQLKNSIQNEFNHLKNQSEPIRDENS